MIVMKDKKRLVCDLLKVNNAGLMWGVDSVCYNLEIINLGALKSRSLDITPSF